jgi:hypothetical protein
MQQPIDKPVHDFWSEDFVDFADFGSKMIRVLDLKSNFWIAVQN